MAVEDDNEEDKGLENVRRRRLGLRAPALAGHSSAPAGQSSAERFLLTILLDILETVKLRGGVSSRSQEGGENGID